MDCHDRGGYAIEYLPAALAVSKGSQQMKLILILTLLSIWLPGPGRLWAQNDQSIMPVSWDKYDDLDKIFLESGEPPPFSSRPYSVDEIKRNLARINPGRLSLAGKTAYRAIEEDLKKKTLARHRDGLALNASLEMNIEGYYHTDEEAQWIHGYEERLPMLDIPLEAWLGNILYANLTLTLREEHCLVSEAAGNYSNVISSAYELAGYTPFQAFFALGGKHWSLRFGRDVLSWGNGFTGNMVLSDYADFHDSLYFTTYWDFFKFSAAYISLDPWLTPAEVSAGVGVNDPYKAFFGHRVEFILFRRLNVALTETVIFGNYYPELRDLNSLMIFHNWNIPKRSNSLMSLELDYNPYKWVNLYGQVAMDEYQTSYEIEAGTGGNPRAMGYIAGAETFLPLGRGYLEAGFEWAQTDPWLYNRETPLLNFINRRRIWSFYSDSYMYVDKPLGYYTGPDSRVLSFRLGYSVSGAYSTMLEVRLVAQGENDLYTDYPSDSESAAASRMTTPTGTPQQTLIFHLMGEVFPSEKLTLGGDIYLVQVKDLLYLYREKVASPGGNYLDLQLALSVGCKL